jgi:predicted alpha/beta-hydrolase family hydrolase
VILGHGAGSDMESPFLVAVQDRLASAGTVVVRFNFPYKERGGRAPDSKRVLEGCFGAVVEQLRDDPELRPRRVVLGGKSMGGRIASQIVAAGAAASGLLFLGYPLHPAGRPEKLRVEHLPRIDAPMLFIQGTRDALCDLELLRRQVKGLPARVDIHVVDGGDHSFKVLKRSGRSQEEVMDEIITATVGWLGSLG